MHGGSIGARDNSESGATFFFELPLKLESEEIICQPKAYLNELMSDDSGKQSQEEDSFATAPYSTHYFVVSQLSFSLSFKLGFSCFTGISTICR